MSSNCVRSKSENSLRPNKSLKSNQYDINHQLNNILLDYLDINFDLDELNISCNELKDVTLVSEDNIQVSVSEGTYENEERYRLNYCDLQVSLPEKEFILEKDNGDTVDMLINTDVKLNLSEYETPDRMMSKQLTEERTNIDGFLRDQLHNKKSTHDKYKESVDVTLACEYNEKNVTHKSILIRDKSLAFQVPALSLFLKQVEVRKGRFIFTKFCSIINFRKLNTDIPYINITKKKKLTDQKGY